MEIGYKIAVVGTYLLLIGLFLWTIAWFITGRYFDNTRGYKKIKNSYAIILSGTPFSLTTLIYASLIVIKKLPKRSQFYKLYGHIDFYSQARTIDKIICYPLVILIYPSEIPSFFVTSFRCNPMKIFDF